MADSPFVDFPAGSTMLREGDAASALFIIETGKAAIERGDAALAELGPGDVFGEAALLQEQSHAANVVARTAVRALKLDSATLPAVIRENVDVATLLMRRLAQRLRVADERGAAAPAPHAASAPQTAPVPAPQEKPASAAAKAAPAAPSTAKSEITAPAKPDAPAPAPAKPDAPAKPAAPAPEAPAVDTRARSPQVSPAPEGAPAPTAQSVPSSPAVVQHVLRHAEGAIALPAGKADCLVGRPDPATGAIPEINLGPLDLARSLSRRHARLLVTGNTVSLREEPGVSNGTWVNGERLAAGQTILLKPGDKLRFGAIELEFGTA
jgi:hypothetical protein